MKFSDVPENTKLRGHRPAVEVRRGREDYYAPLQSNPPVKPFAFRLPKPREVDPYFCANRAFWNEKVLSSKSNNFKPQIRSFVDCKPGKIRGSRWVLYESALQYFQALADQQQPNSAVDSQAPEN